MARRATPGIDGLCVVDKPAGWTSHDVVAKARGILGTRKVGHSGTLDPDATGVLLLGVGRGTRLLRYLVGLPKSYVGELVLGVETSTLDASGEVVAVHPTDGIDVAALRAAVPAFVGDIEQVPPMVSAIRIDGRRLHELAREGIEIDRPARPVTVTRYDVAATADPTVFRIEVDCSSGTYVRSLAADLGRAVGSGAHLRALRRTAVGPHLVADARPLDALDLLPLDACVRHLERLDCTEEETARLRHGGRLAAERVAGDGPWAAFGPAGTLVAILERRADRLVGPSVVLEAAGNDPQVG